MGFLSKAIGSSSILGVGLQIPIPNNEQPEPLNRTSKFINIFPGLPQMDQTLNGPNLSPNQAAAGRRLRVPGVSI